jgi:hypothetical protein
MYAYLPVVLGLLSLLIVSFVISSFFSNRYHARKARELGCQPAPQRPHRLPLGIDLVWQIFQADKENVVPSYFLDFYRNFSHATWIQNFLGTMVYVTSDPKNIQALLATQFKDFEIGETRRANMFPMLGNGIFTVDGKAW